MKAKKSHELIAKFLESVWGIKYMPVIKAEERRRIIGSFNFGKPFPCVEIFKELNARQKNH